MHGAKIKWLFVFMVFAVIPGSMGSASAYTVNGHVECANTGYVLFGAEVKVFEVDPLPGGLYDVESPALAIGTVDVNGDFSITFTWPPGGSGFEVGGPDLIFRYTQNVNNSVETIYEESPAEAHWNVGDGATIITTATSPLAVCTNTAVTPGSIPNNTLFLFTRIGTAEIANIDCRGSTPSSEGYYLPRKAPYNFTGMNSDKPFGHTLDLFGWFGKLCDTDYYKVQYSADGGTSWTDVETSLPNKWYDTSDPNPLNWHWVSESMGPHSEGGQENLYRVPYFVRPDTPWSWLDRVVRFNTKLTADGLCRLKIIGYKWSDSTLIETTSTDLLIDPNYGEIVLQIDNTPPTVEILDVNLNGVSQPACNILSLGPGPGDEVSVAYRVWDQRGHLREFLLDAMYGHKCKVRPRPFSPDPAADNYNNNAAASPVWQGSLSYTSAYQGATYGPGGPGPAINCYGLSFSQMPSYVMPTCAYQLRLHASKRTTNGYGLIYDWVEDTWHMTIQR